jgi:uncharacterized protein
LSQSQVKDILEETRTIAVVGLSNDPEKISYKVSAYMQQHGYNIVPVNPFVDYVLGEKCYKSLLNIPVETQRTIDIVDIFRKTEDILPIVEQAIHLKAAIGKKFVVWIQSGIVNEQAAETARQAGLVVVMDRCLMIEHQRSI